MSERERMEIAHEEPWVFPREASVDEINAFKNGYLAGLKRAGEVADHFSEGGRFNAADDVVEDLAAIIEELETR